MAMPLVCDVICRLHDPLVVLLLAYLVVDRWMKRARTLESPVAPAVGGPVAVEKEKEKIG
jgi:hypothetical protein